jgi:hypothetical protein
MDVKSGQDNLFYQVGKIGHSTEVFEDSHQITPQYTKKRLSEMMLNWVLASKDPAWLS